MLIAILLSFSVSACQPQREDFLIDSTPTTRSAPKVIPTIESYQGNISTPSPLPTRTPLPTLTLTPIIMDTSPKVQLKLTFSADADNSLSTNNDLILNIKEQIYYGGQFGGGGAGLHV